MQTLRDLLELRFDPSEQKMALIQLIQHVKMLEEQAWEAVHTCRMTGKDDEYALGRAHTLDAILGDQDALSRMGVWDDVEPNRAPDVAIITCRSCDRTVTAVGGGPIEILAGWEFDSENGWRCPDHAVVLSMGDEQVADMVTEAWNEGGS